MTLTPQVLRFGIVGATVSAVYVLLYLAFLAIGLVQPLANAFAFMLAVGFQYLAHARFTFSAELNDLAQIRRFIAMILLGFLTSAIITSLIGPALALPDWLSAIAVTVVLPIQNFIFMSRWVFTPEQGRTEPTR